MGNNPAMMVDRDGEWVTTAFKVFLDIGLDIIGQYAGYAGGAGKDATLSEFFDLKKRSKGGFDPLQTVSTAVVSLAENLNPFKGIENIAKGTDIMFKAGLATRAADNYDKLNQNQKLTILTVNILTEIIIEFGNKKYEKVFKGEYFNQLLQKTVNEMMTNVAVGMFLNKISKNFESSGKVPINDRVWDGRNQIYTDPCTQPNK